uniref:Peptidase M1 leukotriene A4 hydrolase/aminopeptidase C-terminal domain-containing protein n=1 Tax=Ditylenchus dipsaci TaxID=166011 RepID=A0A915E0B0_9BILA
MENPCLTFVTPTIIANDRSNISLIAHEITHSWTGNLVTNANWEHFWLNEGFTQFVERKIMGRVYGENIRQFQSLNGWEDNMLPTINTVFNPTHNFTKLIPNMAGCDPDDAFSVIPYEKGSAFLLYLEQKLETPPNLKNFFASTLLVSLTNPYSQRDVLDTIDFDTWLNNPGVPPNKPKYDESLVNECRHLAAKWLTASDQEVLQLQKQQFLDMTAGQKVKVLDCIEALYSLNSVGNYEILKSWILIAIKAKWTPIIEFALEFVTKQGRMKFVKPVYRKLLSWEESKQKALETFEKNIPYMHPITAAVVGTIIKSTVI